MSDIVGIGAAVADTLAVIDDYPAEDTKRRASSVRVAGGGPVGTGLVAAAKLGASVTSLGVLADDAGGRFLLADYKKYGVDTSYISLLPGYRSFTSQIWLSQRSGSRTVVYDKGDLPPFELDISAIAAIQSARLLMLDGNELTAAIAAAKIAIKSDTDVLLDCDTIYDGLMELVPLCNILIPSQRFAQTVTGLDDPCEAAKELFRRYSPKAVAVTCGSRGGVICTQGGAMNYPPYPAQVVDSNGAGDVFHGAFAAAYIRGLDFSDCCHFASAVSAIKCTGVGARESVPDYATTINFLKENGYEL